jgi:hypothetical protein
MAEGNQPARTGGSAPAEGATPPRRLVLAQKELQALAARVYALLQQELKIEQERLGRRRSG